MASEDTELKTSNIKSLTRKPSYSSFSSVLCPDLKNVFFGKIHWAPSEILEVKRPFSRSRRPNFGFHLFLLSFHLEFLLFWVSRSFDLSDLGDLRRNSGNFFTYIDEKKFFLHTLIKTYTFVNIWKKNPTYTVISEPLIRDFRVGRQRAVVDRSSSSKVTCFYCHFVRGWQAVHCNLLWKSNKWHATIISRQWWQLNYT